MATAFKIVRGSEMPEGIGRPGRLTKYPFKDMEVGDAFDVSRTAGKTSRGDDRAQLLVASSANQWAKRHNPSWKFGTRIIDDSTVRIWRVA